MLRQRDGLNEELTWNRSYDRANVERFLALAEAERARRVAEIQRARQRIVAAEAAEGTSIRDAQSRLASLVLAAHRELAKARLENERTVAAILEEAARVLAAADDEARSVRAWLSGSAGDRPYR